jgi:flavin-dependent dehydrogenase
VIGGGPAGSSAASVLARRGHRVLLLEREQFPRFHIGESQLPWIHEVLDEIGAREKVASAGFVKKWGASFATANGEADQYADFSLGFQIPQPQTWQVDRSEFDHLLLKHAEGLGVAVMQRTSADDAVFDDRGVSLTYTHGEARSTVRVAAVIDASGRAGFLAKRFGERKRDAVLNNIAVHRQYEGIARPEGRRAGDIRMVTRPDRGWFWFIPISETVISVGAVIPHDSYKARVQPTAEETLDFLLAETPAAAQLVANARAVTAARFDADYSYLHTKHAGDRYMLVGDAGAFLDPIFSTGVLLAMQSGIEAAKLMSDGIRDGDLTARRFAAWERRLKRRYDHFRRFAVGFYDPAFRDLFFNRSSRFGVYEAVLSVLGGNWRPSWGVRLRLRLFFLLVALQRIIPLVPRSVALDANTHERKTDDPNGYRIAS